VRPDDWSPYDWSPYDWSPYDWSNVSGAAAGHRSTPDFWRASGHHLTEPDGSGGRRPGDDFLRAYLLRPEMVPEAASCAAERALHERLMTAPRRAVSEIELAALVDGDARHNYRAWLRYRDALLAAPSLAAGYLDLVRSGAAGIPPLFLDHLVQVVLHQLLDGCADPLRVRAAELLFREQKVTIDDGQILLADEETVEMHSRGQGFGSLGRLLVEAETPLRSVELDVLDEAKGALYWERSDRFDTVLDLGFTRPGLDGLCRVLETWVGHFTGTAVTIQPVRQIQDQRWVWHVGLDAEANALLNDLYAGQTPEEARLARLLALFRLEFRDPQAMLARVRGRPVYLGLAMTERGRLKLKPQNLLLNLPLTQAV
jgi:hypothetical protein